MPDSIAVCDPLDEPVGSIEAVRILNCKLGEHELVRIASGSSGVDTRVDGRSIEWRYLAVQQAETIAGRVADDAPNGLPGATTCDNRMVVVDSEVAVPDALQRLREVDAPSADCLDGTLNLFFEQECDDSGDYTGHPTVSIFCSPSSPHWVAHYDLNGDFVELEQRY